MFTYVDSPEILSLLSLRLHPEFTRPVLQGFGQVVHLHTLLAGQVGNGAAQREDAMVRRAR